MTEQAEKILFVDDEASILSALKRLLIDEKWDCHFVLSAKEALELLAKEKFDLLVSDVMMPEMDGCELLAEVKKNHPSVIRLFLTGFAKKEKVSKALTEGYAQQIIPKPWIDQELKEIIRSALRQSAQQKKHSQKFQTIINSIPLLPALPESYSQVQNCILDDDVNIEKMADIIGLDVAMSSTLLHWANSALFGQRFRVDTIKKAIVVLGTDIVINLILSESVSQSMASATPQIDGFDLKRFKSHSIATAIIARLLIKSLHSSNSDLQDRVFIAGLLHDIGKLVAASHFSQSFSTALQESKQRGCPLYEIETETLRTTHAELGSFLAEWWALPHFIVSAIQLHHDPASSPIEPEIVDAVHLANLITYRIGYGCNDEKIEQKINQNLWNKFYLTEEGLEILQVETETIMKGLSC